MREYDSGATRDDLGDKLSYFKALSPIVLRRYVQYLGSHRLQADGKLRDWDNWKRGIPMDDYMDSLLRHMVDAWLTYMDYETPDNTSLENLLCAIVFNSMGALHVLLNREL